MSAGQFARMDAAAQWRRDHPLPSDAPVLVCWSVRSRRAYRQHHPRDGRCRRCGVPSTAYDPHAGWYDGLFHDGRTDQLVHTLAVARELLRHQPYNRLVDLGCGPGLVSAALVSDGWRVTGVDASAPMLAYARRRLPRVVHAPVTDTGLDDASTPVVLSTWTHTDVPWSAMVAEVTRIVEPGGVFVYVGGDPGRYPPPSPGGMRERVGWQARTEEELLTPLVAAGWVIRRRVAGAQARWPILGLLAVRP